MANALLFIFGACIGSFLNVVSLRYDPDKFLFGQSILGRSHCMHCGKTLRWFELIPIASFIIQGGTCRSCHARLRWQYPIVELISGLIFVFVPMRLADPSLRLFLSSSVALFSALWIVVFLLLLLMALIDFRLSIIPDEINVLLFAVGLVVTFVGQENFGETQGSFLGPYALLFGLREGGAWVNHLVLGAFGAGVFFLLLMFFTMRLGEAGGIGAGDLKLAIPLGLVFGWPDTLFLVGLAFILGSFAGIYTMIRRRKTLKSYLPFGPFLALSATLTFFIGFQIVHWYFSLFGLK